MSIYWDPNDSLKRVVSCCKNFLSEVIAVAQCCCWSRYFFLKDFRTAFKLASIDNLKELRSSSKLMYTQTNIFWILLNEPEIRLYLPFFDWFGTKRTSVWFQNNRKMVNTIWFWVDVIIFRKDFSVCTRIDCAENLRWIVEGWPEEIKIKVI